ncbi:CMRF35-like molecule 3 [Fukomys damarensis]|uniref:CMRF35-like molecule 3 n=1 Tax=Fukomys damarensis TaxID=885580 RepID=UPI0014550F19|nr:CMRF35-like molecule 3 [Fukomys damarensis]
MQSPGPEGRAGAEVAAAGGAGVRKPVSAQSLFLGGGCFSLQGPESVRGLAGGSVTVQCHYSRRWKTYNKWWCRGASWYVCEILVKTRGSEQEERSGRVSIRDDPRAQTFQVTMERLRQDDADTYWCGIERSGTDLGTSVKVAVDPVVHQLTGIHPLLLTRAPLSDHPNHWAPHLQNLLSLSPAWVPPEWKGPGILFSASLTGTVTMSSKPLAGSSEDSSMGVSSGSYRRLPELLLRVARTMQTHYILLVFVKVPILLILVGAVLWLKGPQRVPEEQWEHPTCVNLNSELLTNDKTPSRDGCAETSHLGAEKRALEKKTLYPEGTANGHTWRAG